MFERYTESARRALFFARYEVTQMGGATIETEHLLLGLLRERHGPIAAILAAANVSPEDLRKDIEAQAGAAPKIPTSVEIPFSAEAKRVLNFAATEADGFKHRDIGPEHLLLGLLREYTSVAASLLTRRGVRVNDVRNVIVKVRTASGSPTPDIGPDTSLADFLNQEIADSPLPDEVTARQIDRIKELVEQLARMPAETSEARALGDQIRDALERLKRRFEG